MSPLAPPNNGNHIESSPSIKVTPVSGSYFDNAPSTPHSVRRLPAQPIRSHESTKHTFRPYPGNPLDPIDKCVDTFLKSRSFELICVQAVQLSAILPTSPPPTTFISFDCTPMHQWYQSLLMEFIDSFMRKLRLHETFPKCYTVDQTGNITSSEDANAFNTESIAHINAILAGFNNDFASRGYGSTAGLNIDVRQPHSGIAASALEESIRPAVWPPKQNWIVGEPLHGEYKRRLRMFEAGVTRLLAERDDARWILGLPGKLDRGVNAYKEFYVRHLRDEILKARRGSWFGGENLAGNQYDEETGDVFT